MTPSERDAIVAAALRSPEGRERFRESFQLGAAIAADKLPEGSLGQVLARKLAGLPT